MACQMKEPNLTEIRLILELPKRTEVTQNDKECGHKYE